MAKTLFGEDGEDAVGGARGQAQGLPLPERLVKMTKTLWEAREGRHKACPYRSVW